MVVARFTCRRLSMKSSMTAFQPLSSSSTERVMVGVALSLASIFFLASASEQWRSSTSCLSWQTFRKMSPLQAGFHGTPSCTDCRGFWCCFPALMRRVS